MILLAVLAAANGVSVLLLTLRVADLERKHHRLLGQVAEGFRLVGEMKP